MLTTSEPKDAAGEAYMVEKYGKTTMPIPCGKCLHCAINNSRTWQHRIMLETMAWEQSSFWSLSMDNEYLYYRNKDPTKYRCELDPMDLTRFFQKLRRELKKYDRLFKYFAIGEYGVPGRFKVAKGKGKPGGWKDRLLGRPHYHCMLFGVGSHEKGLIEKCWRYGNYKNRYAEWEGISIGNVDSGDVNKDTAQYVTAYCKDKITKDREDIVFGRASEFQRSSTVPAGIGDGGLKIVADELKDDPHWDNETIISEINHGGKTWPLGRYLMNRWIIHMDIPPKEVQKFKNAYRNCLIDEHCGNGEIFMENLMEATEQRRKRQARIYKIRSKRRYL